MTIPTVNSPVNSGYAQRLASTGTTTGSYGKAAAVDRVTLSPEAAALKGARASAADQGDPSTPPAYGQIGLLPPWMGSYEETLKRSEVGMKRAMEQLGIPDNVEVRINANNSDGSIRIEGAFPKRAELEALVNNNTALRNVLVATDSNARIRRAAEEAEKARNAAEANPAAGDSIFSALLHLTSRIPTASFQLSLSRGNLSGAFTGETRARTGA